MKTKTFGFVMVSIVLGGISVINLVPLGTAVIMSGIIAIWTYMAYDAIRARKAYYDRLCVLNERRIKHKIRTLKKAVDNNQKVIDYYISRRFENKPVYNGCGFVKEV